MATLVGRTLGHYRITEKIGEGGMGAVYRARDQRLQREVAIKILPETLAEDPGRLERFEREARAAAALDHPNILAIHELGSHEDRPFIVTALLEGSSLRDRLDDGAPAASVALDWTRQMAKGLAAAHQKGIIHRDLKPENVFVTTDGTVKILDFGLAKLVPAADGKGHDTEAATETMHTAIGTVMGTSGYMSPEQVRGQVVDPRSDVFSFGVVLYEMLTGSNPFRRATAADSASAVLSEDPPELSGSDRPLPAGLDRIASRCLAKRPEDRFQSASEIVSALREGSGELSSAAPARPRGRRTPLAIAVGAGAAAILAVAAVLAIRSNAERDPQQVSETQPPRVMILPFENLGSEEHDYFAAGITDELTSRLASVLRLQVVLGSDTVQISDGVVVAGGEPDVDYALDGTVRWNRPLEGPVQVRITPKLLRISDARVLWSRSYDRRLDDIFEVQSEIASRVLEALDIALLSTERDALEAQPTSNMEAYQAYLRGLYYAESYIDEELYLAVAMFEQAVELDPSFALAHAELAMAHARLVSDRVDVSPSRIASAGAAADRALELEPDLARGHLARAVAFALAQGRRERALEELDIALGSAPNDPRILLWKGLFVLGEPSMERARSSLEEAVDVFGRVLDLDPENYQAQTALGLCLGALRLHAAADLAFQRAIRLQPDRLPAYLNRYWYALAWEGGTGLAREVLESVPADRHRDVIEVWTFTFMVDRQWEQLLETVGDMSSSWVESSQWRWPAELVECHAHRGLNRVADVQRSCEQARYRIRVALEDQPDDPRLWVSLAYGEALPGNGAEAVRAADRALELARPTVVDQAEFTFHLAVVHAMVGNADRAVDVLGEALDRPGWVTRAWLRFDWRFDGIREDPGFQRLLRGGS